MPEALGLLQGLGDVRGLSREEPLTEEEKDVRLKLAKLELEDPFLQVIMHSKGISPEAKALIRANEEKRIKRQQLELELKRLQPQNQEGLLSTIGGIPIGLQVGTYLGIKQPVVRFLTDLIIDPVNLIGGVGTLSKLGRSGRLLKGLTAAEKAEHIIDGGKFLARALDNPALADDFIKAATKESPEDLIGLFRRFKKEPLSPELIANIEKNVDPDFARFLKNEKQALSDLRSVFSLEEKQKALDLTGNWMDQLKTGQRSLLRIGYPWAATDRLADVTLPKLFGVIKPQKLADEVGFLKARNAVNYLDELVPVGEAGVKVLPGKPLGLLTKLVANPDTALTEGADFVKAFSASGKIVDDSIETLAKGRKSIVQTLSETFKKTPDEIERIVKTARPLAKETTGQAIFRAFNEIATKEGKLAKFGGPSDQSLIERLVGIEDATMVMEKAKKVSGSIQEDLNAFGRFAEGVSKMAGRTDDIRRGNNLRDSAKIRFEDKVKEMAVNKFPAKERQAELIPLGKRVKEIEKEIAENERLLAKEKSIFLKTRMGLSKPQIEEIFKGDPGAAEIRRRISQHLSKNSNQAIKGFKITPLSRTLQKLPQELVAQAEKISPSVKGGVDLADELAGPGVSKFAEPIMKSMTGRSAALLASIGNHFTQYIDTITGEWTKKHWGTPNVTELPVVYGNAISAELASGKSLSKDIQQMLKVFFGGDVDALERALKDIEQRGRFLKPDEKEFIAARNLIEDNLNTIGQALQDHGLIEAMLSRYVPHITKRIGKNVDMDEVAQQVARFMVNRNVPFKHGRPRIFDDIEALERWIAVNPGKIELTTKRLDETIGAYLRAANQSMFYKRRLIDELGAAMTPEGLPIAKAVMPKEILYNGYSRIKHPFFDNWAIHPQYAQRFRSIFDQDIFFETNLTAKTIGEKVTNGLLWANNMGRAAIFRHSLVHFNSLFQGVTGGLPINTLPESWTLLKGSIRNLFRNFFGMDMNVTEAEAAAMSSWMKITQNYLERNKFQDISEAMATMYHSGVLTGSHDMAGKDVWDATLKLIAEKAPAIKHPITGVRHMNALSDVALWEYFQKSSKILYFMNMRAREIKRWGPDFFKDASRRAAIEYEIGNATNTILGDLPWDRMLVDPTMRNFLRIALVAPTWTIANLKTATDMFLNIPGLRNGIGGIPLVGGRLQKGFDRVRHVLNPDMLHADTRFRLATEYSVRSAVMAYAFGNAINFAFQGRFLWENGPDAVDEKSGLNRIELPYTRWDGKKQYMDYANQITEPLEMIHSAMKTGLPVDFLTPKLGILPRAFVSVIIGYDPIFDRAIYGQEDGPIQNAFNGIKQLGSSFIPITANVAKDVLIGRRDIRSAAISSIGYQAQTESPEFVKERKKREQIETQLEILRQ